MKDKTETHPEFIEGYRDGLDKDCPEPNENRSERYKHSFRIGRAEIKGQKTPPAQISRANAAKAERIENEK